MSEPTKQPWTDCALCGAPVTTTPLDLRPHTSAPGYTQRFDGERFLREKIAALTDEQIARCDAIGRSAEMHTESRPEYYNAFREALSQAMGAAVSREAE